MLNVSVGHPREPRGDGMLAARRFVRTRQHAQAADCAQRRRRFRAWAQTGSRHKRGLSPGTGPFAVSATSHTCVLRDREQVERRGATRRLRLLAVAAGGAAIAHRDRPVNTRPVTHGPAAIARTANGNRGLSCALIAVIPAGPPMTSSTPPHETVNVSAK